MKDLLYYQDATISEFQTTVVKTGSDENRNYIVLNNTAFYPTGGGQPHDTGWISDIEIIDVEKVDEEIRHYTTADVSNISGEISAKLNWTRRFDHMQQHTGQHILTAAFVELFDFATTSFHLGTELVTIDLNVSDVTDAQLAAAEQRANEIILENRPVETKWVTKDDLAHYNLRKDVKVDEDIRLVIIPDFDYNGCGGTHPTSTGQVSLVKILATEKMKQQIRVHFVCGQRVLQQLAMRKFAQAAKHTEKSLKDAQDALLQYEAKALASEAIAARTFENRSIQELQKLARFITEHNEQAIALLVATNDDKLQFVAARGKAQTTSMKTISAAVLPLINGKGGGNDALVQGGGEKSITADALLQAMKDIL